MLVAGCGPKTPIQRHPPNPVTGDAGSKTTLDADAYDLLLATHDVIESTKTSLAAGSFPAEQVPTVKATLNATIDGYNALDTAYRTYHADQSPANTAALNTAVANAQSAKQKLASFKK